MDQLKIKMQRSNECLKEKKIEELVSIPQHIAQQVAQEIGKEANDMEVSMSMWSAMDPYTSKECIASIVRRKQQVAQYDITANILYINAMKSMKHVQLSLVTNIVSTEQFQTHIHDVIEIMKALGKMLRLRNSTRVELDMKIMHYIKNLTNKKNADSSVIKEINTKIKRLRNVGVQTDIQLYQIKDIKRHEQRESAKRKEIFFLEDDKVQEKKKKITQSGIEKNLKKSKESGTLRQKYELLESWQQKYPTPRHSQVHAHQDSTANEGHFRVELSHGFLGQLEAMQQLVQQLRTRLLVGEENLQTMNKNKATDSTMQELKLIKDQKKKAKKQKQRQQVT